MIIFKLELIFAIVKDVLYIIMYYICIIYYYRLNRLYRLKKININKKELNFIKYIKYIFIFKLNKDLNIDLR